MSENIYINSDTLIRTNSMQLISNKVVSRIYGHGRGWVFTKKDLADCGGSMAVEKALFRLRQKGVIRLLLRGVYDYPRFSRVLKAQASPEGAQIAQTIARKFGWSIYPSGETALNLLGLSRQVSAKYVYYSDGPSRKYNWKGGELTFIKRTKKETSSMSYRTVLVVHALKALGQENIDQDVLNKLAKRLSAKEKSAALREARYVTAWIYDAIQKMALLGGASG